MVWPDWEVFKVTPDKPHRRPFASCKNIRKDMIECLKRSPCFKSGSHFGDCLSSTDKAWITPECAELREGYYLCRRNLLNPMRRLRPTKYT